jgi:hypothetical protein
MVLQDDIFYSEPIFATSFYVHIRSVAQPRRDVHSMFGMARPQQRALLKHQILKQSFSVLWRSSVGYDTLLDLTTLRSDTRLS